MNKILPFKFPIFRLPYQKIYFMPFICMVHGPFFGEVCLLKKPRFSLIRILNGVQSTGEAGGGAQKDNRWSVHFTNHQKKDSHTFWFW